MRTTLYFIAIIVPEPIASDIRALQQQAAAQFNSKHALRSPPHITLVAPFAIAERYQHDIAEAILPICASGRPFEIALDGFGAFDDRVIFVEVPPVTQMTALANACVTRLQDNAYPVKVETRPFHPHVTIAFRDLRRDMFPEAFQYFEEQDFHCTFQAQAVSILKHSKSGWQVIEEVKLGDDINPAES